MKFIGAHVAVDGGVASAPLNAAAIGAKAFAMFTRNPSRWKSDPLLPSDIEAFKANCQANGYSPEVILPHDSYLINLGAKDPKKLFMSRMAFLDEMQRCEQLGLSMLNFHPGSHLNEMTEEECLRRIASSINKTLEKTSGVKAVIENTAGQGSNLGFSFEQLAFIISLIEDKSRVGVCIDSCHAFAAGYDLATPQGYSDVWRHFDETIGLKYLSAMHINDSKKGLGSHVDRHESMGQGALGMEFFRLLMADPRMNDIPLILETPNPDVWAEEIKTLYSLPGAL
ncbi:MAG: deoxyribonuclease IV [Muribaculaceae bacterium]|nr:deoxyribonuclease IV [Bacteroides sp.]MDE6262711.1 deoxyribonuclease IV [Muribaculaceae bacterium]